METSEIKNIFTSYWHYLALQKACTFQIFDVLQYKRYSLKNLAKELKLNEKALSFLLAFLCEEKYLGQENEYYFTAEKGLFLTENHPKSIKNACLLWGEEHLTAWQNLDFTLQTGKASFEKNYQKNYFDYLNEHQQKLKNYHYAMRDYAREDYKNIAQVLTFSPNQTIADIGGSLGTLIEEIADNNSENECILFDLPAVIKLFEHKTRRNFSVVSGSFFEPLPFKADVIILSRILHDWQDDLAIKILKNCKDALKENGVLYVIEILQDEIQANLLALNMLVMCQSYERTADEYDKLLQNAGFSILSKNKLNDFQMILKCN